MMSSLIIDMQPKSPSNWAGNLAIVVLAVGLAILLFCACATPRTLTPAEIQTRNSQCFDRVSARARTGDAAQQRELAIIYRDGLCGVKPDPAEARKWLTAAADGKNNLAQMELARAYEFGQLGLTPDFNAAAARYRALIAQLAGASDPAGSALRCNAEFGLGSLYENGKLGAPDMTQAISFYERSALCSSNASARQLSSIYERGNGVPRNLVEAYKWARLATWLPKGDLERLSKQMTPEEIAKAEAAAQAWRNERKNGETR